MAAKPASVLAKVIAAGMLLGALGRHAYPYYTLQRWLVCAGSAFSALQAAELKRTGWLWSLAILALLFNPLLPVPLSRDTWTVLDLAASALLLASIAAIDRRTPPS